MHDDLTIINPKIPLKCKLQSLNIGDLIVCKGDVPQKSHRFDINIQKDNGDGRSSDTLLRVKVNVDKQTLGGNVHIGGKWGKEVTSKVLGSLRPNQHFICLILVKQRFYRVSYNKEHLFDYKHHRWPSEANRLLIDGSVDIVSFSVQKVSVSSGEKITHAPKLPAMPVFGLGDRIAQREQESKGDEEKSEELNDVEKALRERRVCLKRQRSVIVDHILEYNPDMPFQRTIKRGLRIGSVLYFSAKPKPLCEQFEFAFKAGQGISAGSKEFALLLRFNYQKGIQCGPFGMGKWLPGNVHLKWTNDVPVKIGQHFDLIISSEESSTRSYFGRFVVSINGSHLAAVPHSVESLALLKMLVVCGDLQLIHVRFQH